MPPLRPVNSKTIGNRAIGLVLGLASAFVFVAIAGCGGSESPPTLSHVISGKGTVSYPFQLTPGTQYACAFEYRENTLAGTHDGKMLASFGPSDDRMIIADTYSASGSSGTFLFRATNGTAMLEIEIASPQAEWSFGCAPREE